jgi:hypothetical protein
MSLGLVGSAVAATADSGAADNAQHMQWVEKSSVVHILIFTDDGRPGQPPAVVPGSSPIRFGFEWGGESLEQLQTDILDNELHDITLSIDGGPAISVKSGYQAPFVAVPGSGPRWSWDHDHDGLGDGNGNSIGDWDGPVVFWRYAVSHMSIGTHTFDFAVTEDGWVTVIEDTITAEFIE